MAPAFGSAGVGADQHRLGEPVWSGGGLNVRAGGIRSQIEMRDGKRQKSEAIIVHTVVPWRTWASVAWALEVVDGLAGRASVPAQRSSSPSAWPRAATAVSRLAARSQRPRPWSISSQRNAPHGPARDVEV